MASINTKNIHRSNYLLNCMYGEDFTYDEMLVTGPGDSGKKRAVEMAQGNPMAGDETKPGDGPSKEERESGFYDILIIGENDNMQSLKLSVKGDRDPGYGSTSKMIAGERDLVIGASKRISRRHMDGCILNGKLTHWQIRA